MDLIPPWGWTLYNLSAEYVSNFSVGSVNEWRHLPREAGGLEKVTQDDGERLGKSDVIFYKIFEKQFYLEKLVTFK